MRATADIYDELGDRAQTCAAQLRGFGARRRFSGVITTVSCEDDNVLVKQAVEEDGRGRVLVVDGQGSLRAALMGDLVAATAARHGWEGVVVHGAVRDVDALADIDLGIKALGSNPRRSNKSGAGERDVPVRFGGAQFVPGHLLYADADGILVVAP